MPTTRPIPPQKFVASYSGGKDSALALYRALERGYTPLSLLTTCNVEAKRSWFHGIPAALLDQVAEALGIPLLQLATHPGEGYAHDFTQALAGFKAQGAQACVFGDIDLEDHRTWCTARCEAAGLAAFFPLWQEKRRDLVHELIDLGFKAVITIVDTTKLGEEFLGQTLTRALAEKIEAAGADICGENGEYHTFVYDGPLFKRPIPYTLDAPVRLENSHYEGNYVAAPIR